MDASQVAEKRGADLRLKLAQLRERVDREQQIVKSLFASERQQKSSALAKELNVGLPGTSRVDEQIGRASMSILLSADRVRGRKESQGSAGRDYELVIAKFPNTPWADMAKERLASLQP